MSTDLTPSPAFQKAKSLFRLQAPDPATDDAWNIYTINRLGAPQHRDFITDSEDEEEERFVSNREFLYTITRALNSLEVKMGLQDNCLRKCHRVLDCYAHYGGVETDPDYYSDVDPDHVEPEIVRVTTRIYSPSRPMYIDICLDYRWLIGGADRFDYFMTFKITRSPTEGDYESPDLLKLRQEGLETRPTPGGWRVIAHGGSGATGHQFLLNTDDIKNIRDVLWGPQEDLPENADEEPKVRHRRELVNGICILFAAVGIQCNIACTNSEGEDFFGFWELGQIRSWIAREVRNVCGFQLQRDQGQVP